MSYNNRSPFSDVVAKGRVITSAAVTQMITRVPWQPGAQKHYNLRKVTVTAVGAGPSLATFWDQDLSSATPAVRGNASTGALITVAAGTPGTSGAAVSTIMGLNELSRVRFEAGVCCQTSAINTAILLELEMV